MILIAFDIDGTVDSSAGPVKWAKVRAMACPKFIRLGIVSPSRARPQDGVPVYLPNGGGDRTANLRAFANANPGADLKLYVSNNGDSVEAAMAGFAYVDHIEFARGLG